MPRNVEQTVDRRELFILRFFKLLVIAPVVLLILFPILLFISFVMENLTDDEKVFLYFKANNTTIISLSLLANHPVTRVCLIPEYTNVNAVAGKFNFDLTVRIAEGAVGYLMMNENRASVLQFEARYFDQPLPGNCVQGDNIRLEFVPLDPAFKWQDRMDIVQAAKMHMSPRFVLD